MPQVERPSEALPPDAEAALQVAARVFAFESRPQSGGSAAVLAPSLHAQLPLGRDRYVRAGTLRMDTWEGNPVHDIPWAKSPVCRSEAHPWH